MTQNHKVIIDSPTLQAHIARLASQIRLAYAGRQPLLVSLLEGALPFAAALQQHIGHENCRSAAIRASSYGSATASSGRVTIDLMNAAHLIPGSDVLLLDDIYDTGLTLAAVIERITELAPRSLAIAVLLRRLRTRQRQINIDFVGADIETDEFLAGFGLDYHGRLRDLPYIIAVNEPI